MRTPLEAFMDGMDIVVVPFAIGVGAVLLFIGAYNLMSLPNAPVILIGGILIWLLGISIMWGIDAMLARKEIRDEFRNK